MSHPERTFIPVVTISAMFAGLEALGFDADRARDAAGVDRELLDDPWAAVPFEVFERVWRWAALRAEQPHIAARTGAAVPFGALGILDHIVASGETLGAGLHALRLYFRLVSDVVALELQPEEDHVAVVLRARGPALEGAMEAFASEWTVGVMVQRFTQPTAPEILRPVVVSLSHRAEDRSALEGILDIPVRDGAGRDAVLFDRRGWDIDFRGADPTLHENLSRIAERADIQRFEVEPIACAVRERLAGAIEAEGPELAHVARRLGMSERTLQRRLSDADLDFQTLLDQYRRDEAMRLLADPDRSIAEVAYELGFASQSSLTRAFRRWTGTTPGVWREEH